jgi:hypothetical protein
LRSALRTAFPHFPNNGNSIPATPDGPRATPAGSSDGSAGSFVAPARGANKRERVSEDSVNSDELRRLTGTETILSNLPLAQEFQPNPANPVGFSEMASRAFQRQNRIDEGVGNIANQQAALGIMIPSSAANPAELARMRNPYGYDANLDSQYAAGR